MHWQHLRCYLEREAGISGSKFLSMAVRPTSGAQALLTSGAVVIAGLAAAMHEAGRVRDMRKYPFLARGGAMC